MTYIVTPTDIENLDKILTPYYEEPYFTRRHLKNDYEICQRRGGKLKDFSFIYSFRYPKVSLAYDYFETKGNPYECCRQKIITMGSYDEPLEFFRKSLKKYKPSDTQLEEIVEKLNHLNQKSFLNITKLSLAITDEEKSIQAFIKVLKKSKKFVFKQSQQNDALEMFENRFSQSIKTTYSSQIKSLLPSLNKQEYLLEDQAFYYSMLLDADILSNINQVSIQTNRLGVRALFLALNQYAANKPDNFFALKRIKLDPDHNQTTVLAHMFFNSDPTSKKPFLTQLFNLAIEPSQNTTMGCVLFEDKQKTDAWFDKFVLKHQLDGCLEAKPAKHKSAKI